MPAEDVADLEIRYPGIVSKTCIKISGMFDARLRKRYAAPFETPYPDALVFNVALEVAYRLWLKRGFNPTSAQDSAIVQDHTDAMAWLKEAADSEKGLLELPKKEDGLNAGGVSAGAPLSYSEQSPYVWADNQRDDAEDFQ